MDDYRVQYFHEIETKTFDFEQISEDVELFRMDFSNSVFFKNFDLFLYLPAAKDSYIYSDPHFDYFLLIYFSSTESKPS